MLLEYRATTLVTRA